MYTSMFGPGCDPRGRIPPVQPQISGIKARMQTHSLISYPMVKDSTDVLIIGAGPAGLMAALVLSMMKVKVRLLDRRLPHEVSGQADGIQPRMIEIWESLGIGRELRDRSEHVHRMVTYKPRADGTGIQLASQMDNISVQSARYQFEILARIDIIEQILEERLKAEGVIVEHSVVPISLDIKNKPEDPYPVKVKVAQLNPQVLNDQNISQEARGNPESFDGLVDNFHNISVKFVIGCDGGKSWTRKQLNIAMEGNQTDLDWGVMDFTPRTNFPTPRAKNIIQSPLAGALGYLPRPNGAARVYVMLGEGQAERVVPRSEAIKIVAEKLRRGFAPYEMEAEDVTWCSIFRASQRVAKCFSGYGRIFIAGDACHTHSPKAGQGANAAMSDTFNLAWKLGYVVHQHAKQDILETYEQERRPHSLELIELDRKIFRLFGGQTVTPEEYTNLWHEQIMFASGIGTRYTSLFIDTSGQSLAPGLLIGERIPSLEVVRTEDWRPLNLHDICLFNGKFRLFILPGSILNSNTVARLAELLPKFNTARLPAGILDSYIIIDADNAVVVESHAAALILNEGYHDRIFFGQNAGSRSLYATFEVAGVGVVFLVRPDNHVSAIVPFDEAGVCKIAHYFSSWISPQ
ncbi:Phenol 2-monooxygenase [Mycena sanguinolenta]|uniref:Phenol 2-monooxygenase n=1 Tax=Mycena sanguinolenta TaxID=230812 RepID=A0A8H6YYL0_9AGAR|nr:Phenol 2-monooxygenase [Mycena sanguinolenta]